MSKYLFKILGNAKKFEVNKSKFQLYYHKFYFSLIVSFVQKILLHLKLSQYACYKGSTNKGKYHLCYVKFAFYEALHLFSVKLKRDRRIIQQTTHSKGEFEIMQISIHRLLLSQCLIYKISLSIKTPVCSLLKVKPGLLKEIIHNRQLLASLHNVYWQTHVDKLYACSSLIHFD